MRILAPSPASFFDPATSAPAFGSYEGPLPPVELTARPLVERALRRKKWLYAAVASEQIWLSLAVVRMGYATSAFAFVLDRAGGRMLFDRAVVGPPGAAAVTDDPSAPGTLARFGLGRTRIDLARRGDRVEVVARFAGLDAELAWEESAAPPAISAIAEVGPRRASATTKRALAAVGGRLVVGGRRVSLDGAVAGYDYTQGLMPRHTRWNWAFAMGRATDGAPVAFNLVEGFVGEAECAAFGAGVHPLAEPRFVFDATRPEAPWRIEGDGVDLVFEVAAVHAQRRHLGLVRTRFLQPVGTFRGTVRLGGRDVALRDVPGVVEDQDVLW